jgi:hypothetical protein
MKSTRILAAAIAAVSVASLATGSTVVGRSYGMTGSFRMATEPVDGCTNNPGPYISIEGDISLGDLSAVLRFSNNLKGTHQHEEDVTTSVTLVSDEAIHFAKQPSHGGVGGNPHVWLLLHASDGTAIGDPMYLGRCVQGFTEVSLDLLIPALAEAEVIAGGCSGRGGPQIELEGGLTLGGLDGTLVFTNNNNAFTHVHEEDVTVGLTLIPEGETITFPKQPPQGGAGGNPHVFLQFVDGSGNPIGDEFYLGRCSRL